MNETMLTLSDALLNARQAKEHAEGALKECNAIVDELEGQLIGMMLDSELTNFKRNGISFTLANRTFISAEAEQKDKLWAAMKKEGYEHLFSINANTLSAEVKRLTEDNHGNLPAWLEGLVKQYEKPIIQIRK